MTETNHINGLKASIEMSQVLIDFVSEAPVTIKKNANLIQSFQWLLTLQENMKAEYENMLSGQHITDGDGDAC